MSATTGTRLGVSHTVGSSAVVGQGTTPEAWILYSTDDVSTGTPTWADATSLVRSFSTRRGRDNELSEIDAGQATLVLDNRTRAFDPVSNASIRPLNRWWIREQFSGETQDIYYGYAESYEQGWEGAPNDATATVSCADEFKVLALANLPTTSPPRNSYAEVVAAERPDGFWNADLFQGGAASSTLLGDPGIQLTLVAGVVGFTGGSGAIVGEEVSGTVPGATGVQQGSYFTTNGLVKGDAGDVTGLTEFTIEGWFSTTNGASSLDWVVGPKTTGPTSTYRLYQTANTFGFEARNSSGTNVAITGGTLVTGGSGSGPWFHVAGVIRAGNIYLYVNGAQVATAAWSGSFATTLDATAALIFGHTAGLSSDQVWFDEVAFYRVALSAATIANHYIAGVNRGFGFGQRSDLRAGQVLDTITSHAPRSIRPGSHGVTASYMKGQSPLEELRKAKTAENVDAMVFIARDGILTFLDAGHRGSSPWATTQATFGDANTTGWVLDTSTLDSTTILASVELGYRDLTVDFSDTFLVNEWNVTGFDAFTGGTVQTASDATSISRFFKRSQSLTDVPVPVDSQAASISTALLAKYKDPFTRITQITLTTGVPDVAQAVFQRDIGDRIRVLRTPPGGGARIDQTVFIQGIQVDATPDRANWRIQWNVSPL